jgi:hypothetical protein
MYGVGGLVGHPLVHSGGTRPVRMEPAGLTTVGTSRQLGNSTLLGLPLA